MTMLTRELGDCTWFGRLRARLRAPARNRVGLARAAALLLALVRRLARVRLLGAAVHLGAAPGEGLLHLVHHGGHPAPAAPSAPASVSGVPAHSSVPAEQESKVINKWLNCSSVRCFTLRNRFLTTQSLLRWFSSAWRPGEPRPAQRSAPRSPTWPG